MGTTYTQIYNVFLGKVSDYSFASMSDTTLTDTMHNFLVSAIVKFKHCRQDLTQRDDVNDVFTITLTDEETEIIATNMVIEWLGTKALDDKLLRPTLTDKDFNVYSQSNQLAQIRNAREAFRAEVKQLIKDYVYDNDAAFAQLTNYNQPNPSEEEVWSDNGFTDISEAGDWVGY